MLRIPVALSVLPFQTGNFSRIAIARQRRAIGSVLLMALLGSAAPHAHADLFADNEARRAIIDLRQRYLALSEENSKLRESLQTTQTQMESLRGEITRVRSREEQLARELADLKRTAAAAANAEEKTGSANTVAGSPLSAAGSATAVAEAPARPEETANEKAAFDAALNKFRASDYAAAQAGLRAYLQKYPQSNRRIAALYWLGNSDYALRNYRSAMRNYRSVVAQAPNHERAPEALLALSACQVELQDTAGARATLEQLIKSYPRSEAAQAAQDRLTRLR